MLPPIQTTKVEILLKDTINKSNLTITKLEFDNSNIQIKAPYLLVTSWEKDNHNLTTKVFNLSEVSAFKEFRK